MIGIKPVQIDSRIANLNFFQLIYHQSILIFFDLQKVEYKHLL